MKSFEESAGRVSGFDNGYEDLAVLEEYNSDTYDDTTHNDAYLSFSCSNAYRRDHFHEVCHDCDIIHKQVLERGAQVCHDEDRVRGR